MATTTIKSTYSLDVESVRVLETLARRWSVSKSEVLRRAIKLAAEDDASRAHGPLAALDQLQTLVRERSVDLTEWERDVRAERLARRDDPPGSAPG
ncbi:ribbon-helix-helix protein, CopG family [Candidatus Palauibacter sp.]|uniref:ribbon-helix-helix protein, CopG family n=1 Tax=Candidatus Palauibacter sp. TaxID=3101350 RepID=UPI003B018790